jgi:hypothetical protein
MCLQSRITVFYKFLFYHNYLSTSIMYIKSIICRVNRIFSYIIPYFQLFLWFKVTQIYMWQFWRWSIGNGSHWDTRYWQGSIFSRGGPHFLPFTSFFRPPTFLGWWLCYLALEPASSGCVLSMASPCLCLMPRYSDWMTRGALESENFRFRPRSQSRKAA